MKKSALIAGALVLLFLFGCTTTPNGGTQAPTPTQQPTASGTPSTVQVANGIGDADIDVVQVTNDSDTLPTTEPVEADNGVIQNSSAAGNMSGIPSPVPVVSGSVAASSNSDLDSYVDVTQVNDSDTLPNSEPVEADTGN
jgi:hypothetical protein